MNRTLPLVLGIISFLAVPFFAGATATVAPTGAYVPAQNTSDNQNVNINVGGDTIKASNSGADINIPGIGSINANNSGTATVNLNADGQSVSVAADNSGASVQIGTGSGAITVSDDADLATYTAHVQATNPNITSIQTSPTNIQVGYVQHGTLFGFIPLAMQGQIQANAQGAVTVTLPWYSFMAASNSVLVKSNVQTGVSAALANSSGSLTPATQAEVVLAISNGVSSQ